MNEKKAKRLRQYLRDCGVAVGGTNYKGQKNRWGHVIYDSPKRLTADCGRARY